MNAKRSEVMAQEPQTQTVLKINKEDVIEHLLYEEEQAFKAEVAEINAANDANLVEIGRLMKENLAAIEVRLTKKCWKAASKLTADGANLAAIMGLGASATAPDTSCHVEWLTKDFDTDKVAVLRVRAGAAVFTKIIARDDLTVNEANLLNAAKGLREENIVLRDRQTSLTFAIGNMDERKRDLKSSLVGAVIRGTDAGNDFLKALKKLRDADITKLEIKETK